MTAPARKHQTGFLSRLRGLVGRQPPSALERERQAAYEAAKQKLIDGLSASKLTEAELQAQLKLLEGEAPEAPAEAPANGSPA